MAWSRAASIAGAKASAEARRARAKSQRKELRDDWKTAKAGMHYSGVYDTIGSPSLIPANVGQPNRKSIAKMMRDFRAGVYLPGASMNTLAHEAARSTWMRNDIKRYPKGAAPSNRRFTSLAGWRSQLGIDIGPPRPKGFAAAQRPKKKR